MWRPCVSAHRLARVVPVIKDGMKDSAALDASTLVRWWLVSFAVWTAICVLSVTQHCLSAAQRGLPAYWLQTFAGWLPGFHVRALLSPFVLWLSSRWLLSA